ncbi:MAG: type IV pilus modification protein PilV [Betaproteobacteria bacterium]
MKKRILRHVPATRVHQHSQRGSMLLEALIGMLIFSVGILALIRLQAVAIQSTAEARYRSEANFLANQLVAVLWMDQANLLQYAHFATSLNCEPSGTPSPLAGQPTSEMARWLASVAKTLPSAESGRQQITVNADNSVDITLCWHPPQDASWRRLNFVTYINGENP